MTVIFTPAGEPLYWTKAETTRRAWRKFCPYSHPARKMILDEAARAGYRAGIYPNA